MIMGQWLNPIFDGHIYGSLSMLISKLIPDSNSYRHRANCCVHSSATYKHGAKTHYTHRSLNIINNALYCYCDTTPPHTLFSKWSCRFHFKTAFQLAKTLLRLQIQPANMSDWKEKACKSIGLEITHVGDPINVPIGHCTEPIWIVIPIFLTGK